MSEIEDAANSIAGDEPAAPSPDEAQAAAAAGDAEGTTPEEVRSVLKNAGMNLPDEPTPAAADEEEGDEPVDTDEPAADEDKPADGADADKPTGAAGDAADADKPADKPVAADQPTGEPAAIDEEKFGFEVQDASGTTFKILPSNNLEEILAEFEPKNNGQIIEVLDKLRTARSDYADAQAQAETEAQTAATNQRVEDLRTGWAQEAQDLQANKRIPDGKPGEDRIQEVYQFMATENNDRIANQRPTLNSFEDALDKLEAREAREKAAQADKDAKDTSRQNGAKVGGSSAPSSGAAPVYVAGSARTASEAIRNLKLIK